MQRPIKIEKRVKSKPIFLTEAGPIAVRPVEADDKLIQYRGYDPKAGTDTRTFWDEMISPFELLEASPDGRLLAGFDYWGDSSCGTSKATARLDPLKTSPASFSVETDHP